MANEYTNNKKVVERLDKLIEKTNIIIGLLFKKSKEAKLPMIDQIKLFKNMGIVDYKEVARILGKAPKTIANELTKMKKENKKKK